MYSTKSAHALYLARLDSVHDILEAASKGIGIYVRLLLFAHRLFHAPQLVLETRVGFLQSKEIPFYLKVLHCVIKL